MRQWKNEDLYRESGRQDPPWCDERRDARPRRVGGGCRDGSWDHTREGVCSSDSGSSRSPYVYESPYGERSPCFPENPHFVGYRREFERPCFQDRWDEREFERPRFASRGHDC